MPIHCVFCDIIAGKAPASIVYEDKHVVAFLDFQPINEGHCIVATKRHVAYLRDLDPAIGARLFKTAQRIEPALEASGLPCDGTNLFLADHPIAGQKVFHVHLHVFPRHAGDAVRINLGQSRRPERAALDATAARLRAQIESGAPPARRPALDRRRRIHRHDVRDARRRHDRAAHRPVRQQRGGTPGVGRAGAEVGRRRPRPLSPRA